MPARKLFLPATIALLVGATASTAQLVSEPEEREPENVTGEEQTGQGVDHSATGEEDATGPSPETPGDGDTTSPYEYRSSEEISEDRSVSFPVDI